MYLIYLGAEQHCWSSCSDFGDTLLFLSLSSKRISIICGSEGGGDGKTGVFYTLELAVMNFDLDPIINASHLDTVMMSPVPGVYSHSSVCL